MNIRSMQAADCQAVLGIERQCMGKPWSLSQIRSELDQGGGLRLVADHDGMVSGFVLFRCCLPEAELLRIAVHSERYGQGVGAALLEEGLSRLGRCGVESCYLEVRSSNRAARKLYARCGFGEIGRRPRYYNSPQEDAVLMQTIKMPPVGRVL